MELFDGNKILLFIFFFIPGFVALKTYEFFYAVNKKDLGKEILDAVFFSCLNYSVIGLPLIYIVDKYELNIWGFFITGITSLLIAPCFLAFLWVYTVNQICKKTKLGKSPHRTPLEYFNNEIRTDKHVWVQVELKDDSLINGVFGYMTSYPDEVGIYLQQYWTLENDQFSRNDKDLGIVILSNEIKTISFSEI